MVKNARPIPVVLDLHAEDAAILWVRRNIAANAPHYSRLYLSRLDEQLEAHIDGLRVAGPAGWDHAKAAFDSFSEAGEMFTLASLAFGHGDVERIEIVLAALASDPDTFLRPVTAAFGWMGLDAAGADITSLLASDEPIARLAGLGACSALRHDPEVALETALDDGPLVRARAMRLAGEIGRADLLHKVCGERSDDSPEAQFWSQWAATMLGERESGPDYLLAVAKDPEHPHWETALTTAIFALGGDAGWQWLDTLDFEPHSLLLRVKGFGLLGNPQTLPWLVSQLDSAEHGRQAGESFCLITGSDLEFDDLDGDEPEGFEGGPNDDPLDADVDMDPEENVPWGDPVAISRYMQGDGASLPDQPLFMGHARSHEAFEHGFIHGYQRQRRAAAFAMALASPGAPLANWKIPVRDVTMH